MKIQRLFEIVYLLADRRTTTAQALAEHLEVSPRTILRDIATLSSAGVPIYTTQGKGGGIHLLDRYVLDRTVLTGAEQRQVLLGLRALTGTDEQADATLRRLRSLFALDDVGWLEVDLSRWGSAATDRATFSAIRDAIVAHRVLSFTYARESGTGSRRVCPLKLVYKGHAWYLQAARLPDREYRTYRVSRMLDIAASDETFTPGDFDPPPLDPPTPPAGADPPPWGSAEPVRLRFRSSALPRVLDEYDPATVTPTDDGYLVTLRVPLDPWLRGHLLSYGTDVEVLGPAHLRAEVAAAARAIAELNAAPQT